MIKNLITFGGDNGSWYGSPGGIEAKDWTRIGQGDGFRVETPY
jgi:hypothetical protein